jgi:hypothetical protein
MKKSWPAAASILILSVISLTTAGCQYLSNAAIKLSNPTIFVALLGAVVTAVGWAVTSILSTIHDARTRRRVARLEYFKSRLEELYGPLTGIIRQSTVVYQVAMQVLPTKGRDIDQSRFQGKDIEVWRFFQERYFFPLNAEAVNLLKSKTHLIGREIPASFEEFLRHATQFECLFQLWRSTGFDSSGKVKGIAWPKDFEDDVVSRLNDIQAQYAETLELLDLYSVKERTTVE